MLRGKVKYRRGKFWRFAGLVALCLFAGASAAPAEDGGFNFFQKLFGLPPQPQPTPQTRIVAPSPTPSPRRTHRSDYVPATTTRAPGAPGAASGATVQAKFHVEVLGDSLAVLASDGLSEAFADKPEIGFVDRARDASGLVRTDYFDWTKFATDNAVAADKPDFVVIMLGINDGQPLRDGSDTLSDKWKETYGQHIEAFVAPYVAAHIPVAWVSLPPMRVDRANTLAVALNELYRQHAEKAGAKFIDIFDAFADANGQYDAYGPNVDGQKVKLRGSDGIHFTKAGSRKLANFVEGEIKRVFEKRNPTSEVASLPPDIEQAADDINAQIQRESATPPAPAPSPNAEVAAREAPVGPSASPAAPEAPAPDAAPAPALRPVAGPILPLTSKSISPSGALATRETHPLVESEAVVRVLRSGEPQAPLSGRADDFAWPKL